MVRLETRKRTLEDDRDDDDDNESDYVDESGGGWGITCITKAKRLTLVNPNNEQKYYLKSNGS